MTLSWRGTEVYRRKPWVHSLNRINISAGLQFPFNLKEPVNLSIPCDPGSMVAMQPLTTTCDFRSVVSCCWCKRMKDVNKGNSCNIGMLRKRPAYWVVIYGRYRLPTVRGGQKMTKLHSGNSIWFNRVQTGQRGEPQRSKSQSDVKLDHGQWAVMSEGQERSTVMKFTVCRVRYDYDESCAKVIPPKRLKWLRSENLDELMLTVTEHTHVSQPQA